MVNEKGIDGVSSSSPVKMNGKETGVDCQSKDEENTGKEVVNGENAVVEMKNGEIVMEEEEKNEVTASVEEGKNGGYKIEEYKNNEANAIEDDDKEWNATSEDDDEEDEEDGEEEEEDEHEEEEEEEKGVEKEENAIELEEEKVGANSTEKVQGSRKRSRKKEIEEEEKEEEEENTNELENKKVGANSGEKVKRPRKRGRKNKVAGLGSETLATKAEDKPGPSGKEKTSKRAESMGMIFMCSSKTKKDCYRYNVLGLPASKRDIVEKVYKGMRLFLFDFDLKLMYGIYKAAGPGGYNIEPKAFKSAFPSQVRFTVLDDCLPLAEEKFKTVIKENYYGKNKFNCQLTSQQVKDLCKLFSVSSRGSKSKKLSRKARTETHIARAEPRIARAEPRIARAEPRIARGRAEPRIARVRAEPRIARGRAEPHIARGRADPRIARGRAEPRIRVDGGRIRRRSRDEERRGQDEERRSSALIADRRYREARPPAYDRETYRRRDRDEERLSPLVGAHRHRDHPIMYERELAPLHRLQPLPPPTAGALPYASYGRTVELDAYGREVVVERRDPRLLDLDVRHRDEIGSRDPYMSYREIPSYRDSLYSPAVLAPPEYYPPVEPRAEYRLAAPPPSEYRHLGAAPSEYDRLRSLYRY
ncbi:uncharacterized protein LOC131304510 isoform X1 [Rhododendron vialii]|uniref:uncharacterized protein LOC131304510 isoform X1 n=1 Tax=Rhododendron vialii TaxID=182163 RepID=UPI00265E993D|nr:uncharacterized protein LOC131304510 isoform X1 [Rhododendron vialii]XP_058187749.1 uncharacterized protein LOC131304510 isoform X1 [Rhododendron vialii]